MRHILLLSATIFILVSCTTQNSNESENFSDPLITNRDTTINPGNDFFMYANGGWFKRNPIPDSEPGNGIFKMIADTIDSQIKHVCEEAAKEGSAVKGSNKQKIGDLFASGMDTLSIEQKGIEPLKSELKIIEGISDIKSLLAAIAHLHTINADPAFSFYVSQDDKISSKNALIFSQGGLGLGDRDYYFNKDSRNTNIRKEYVKHLATVLELIGETNGVAEKNAIAIMSIETDLARVSRKLEDLRDPVKNYNKMSVEKFNTLTPNIDWKQVLLSLKALHADSVIVGQPEFYSALNKIIKQHTIQDWKEYLTCNLVNDYSRYLNSAIDKERFRFYGTIMRGVAKQKPRWKRVVQETNGFLGELIGQVYVAEYLPKGSKEKLLEIGNNIRDVYADHIRKLEWMSDSTKAKALNKLSKIVMKVGYPDKWKDLSSMKITRDSYFDNALQANMWYYNFMISKYGKPVDRTEWGMDPQTYNAYYNPGNNEICVPACNILVPGFEGRMPDDAILYGIIGGSTFGHELTHGFDDQGSQYDENGNLKNWWTPQDRERFVAKTKRIVKQFDQYKVLDSIKINGDATQGENIADLGGVVMGYEAFKKTQQYKNNVLISGLTPDQRYFLGYAYAWMVNIKDESLAEQIMTDVHSPAQFRINGPLSNVAEFYNAFGIKEHDSMYQPDSLRVLIW